MDRGNRRYKTQKIAERRAKQLKDYHNKFGVFNILPESELETGYFKKNNGFTIKKESSRLWNKILKNKKAKRKYEKRNPLIEK